MEPAAPKTPLYDFIYRDPTRVASYYAQLFKGRLTGIERTDTSKTATESSGHRIAGWGRAELSLRLVVDDCAGAVEALRADETAPVLRVSAERAWGSVDATVDTRPESLLRTMVLTACGAEEAG